MESVGYEKLPRLAKSVLRTLQEGLFPLLERAQRQVPESKEVLLLHLPTDHLSLSPLLKTGSIPVTLERLGCKYQFESAQVVSKRPSSSSLPFSSEGDISWHQDEPHEMVSLWIPLQHVGPSTGALVIRPAALLEGEAEGRPDVCLEMKAGEVVLLHAQTLHMSLPNHGPSWRSALILRFPAADVIDDGLKSDLNVANVIGLSITAEGQLDEDSPLYNRHRRRCHPPPCQPPPPAPAPPPVMHPVKQSTAPFAADGTYVLSSDPSRSLTFTGSTFTHPHYLITKVLNDRAASLAGGQIFWFLTDSHDTLVQFETAGGGAYQMWKRTPQRVDPFASVREAQRLQYQNQQLTAENSKLRSQLLQAENAEMQSKRSMEELEMQLKNERAQLKTAQDQLKKQTELVNSQSQDLGEKSGQIRQLEEEVMQLRQQNGTINKQLQALTDKCFLPVIQPEKLKPGLYVAQRPRKHGTSFDQVAFWGGSPHVGLVYVLDGPVGHFHSVGVFDVGPAGVNHLPMADWLGHPRFLVDVQCKLQKQLSMAELEMLQRTAHTVGRELARSPLQGAAAKSCSFVNLVLKHLSGEGFFGLHQADDLVVPIDAEGNVSRFLRTHEALAGEDRSAVPIFSRLCFKGHRQGQETPVLQIHSTISVHSTLLSVFDSFQPRGSTADGQLVEAVHLEIGRVADDIKRRQPLSRCFVDPLAQQLRDWVAHHGPTFDREAFLDQLIDRVTKTQPSLIDAIRSLTASLPSISTFFKKYCNLISSLGGGLTTIDIDTFSQQTALVNAFSQVLFLAVGLATLQQQDGEAKWRFALASHIWPLEQVHARLEAKLDAARRSPSSADWMELFTHIERATEQTRDILRKCASRLQMIGWLLQMLQAAAITAGVHWLQPWALAKLRSSCSQLPPLVHTCFTVATTSVSALLLMKFSAALNEYREFVKLAFLFDPTPSSH